MLARTRWMVRHEAPWHGPDIESTTDGCSSDDIPSSGSPVRLIDVSVTATEWVPAVAMLLGVVLTLSLWSIPQGCRHHVLSQFDDPSTPAIEGSATANAFCIDKSENVITEFLSAAGSVLVSPAKIVRVSDQSAPLVYWTPTVNTAATIVLTVVVIFTLLAARNYLRVRSLGE